VTAADNLPGPLTGLRVLELADETGQFCGKLLGDLGADVVKIEPPAGDSTREMPGAVGSDSPSFNAVNRGKRSVVLNLKAREGREILERLIKDIGEAGIVEFRPRQEGNTLHLILAPSAKKPEKAEKPRPPQQAKPEARQA